MSINVTVVRPMLAASFSDDLVLQEQEMRKLSYPMLASPKVDGIRFMKPQGQPAMSRSWKALPNKHFQRALQRVEHLLSWVDGEVIVGDDPTAPGLFNKTQSAIMSADGEPVFTIWLFDYWYEPNNVFMLRTEIAKSLALKANDEGFTFVQYLNHELLGNYDELQHYEECVVAAGYEGIMLRHPNGVYKYGRSTLKQQGLIKVKRFTDDEAIVTGFEALERNTNAPTKDVFGLQKRSSHRAGKVSDDLMGKLLCRHGRFGDFAIGSGFDVSLRQEIWQNQEKYLGKTVTFKYQQHGMLERPRMPIFKGFRDTSDI